MRQKRPTGVGWWWLWVLGLGILLQGTGQAQEPAGLDSAEPLQEVTTITFVGNTTFSSGTLRDQLATQQRPLLPWKKGEPYSAPTLEEDLRRIQKYYFDRGFLETRVLIGRVTPTPNGKAVQIELVITEGPRTMVSAVHLTGTIPRELPPLAALRRELPLQPGQPLTKEHFDRSQALLLTYLRNASYARADVVPSTAVDTISHSAEVTLELVPDTRTRFGRITIDGTKQVRERAIRRQLTFQEGDFYRERDVTESSDAVYGLGTFQAVTALPRNPQALEEPLDMAFSVRERTMRTVQAGIGLSSVERFRLRVDWLHHNLLGDAEQLQVGVKVSSIVQALEARLHVPYFLAKRTAFTQTVFVRNEQEINTDPLGLSDALFSIKDAQPAFDLLSMGGETRVTHHVSRTLSLAGGLEFSRNTFRNIDLVALTAAGRTVADDNLLFLQFAEVKWDTSDSLLNPTRGVRVRGRLDHANAALISDVSLMKLSLEGRHYQPLWPKIVLATRLKVGFVQPYGSSEDIPFNLRFFAGGPGSMRGFALNRLGPLDRNRNPVGGNSLLEGSVELRFPIVGDLGGAVFVDAGNVFRPSLTYHLDDLRYAAGPGIRYNTPIGPVRLDVAFLLDRRPGESFGRVEFSLGQAF